jgi:hypothetical protein
VVEQSHDIESGPPALERALATASGLKPGTWESVEILAFLTLETAGTQEAVALLAAARGAASRLKSGTWESARALAWLARAEREVGPR